MPSPSTAKRTTRRTTSGIALAAAKTAVGKIASGARAKKAKAVSKNKKKYTAPAETELLDETSGSSDEESVAEEGDIDKQGEVEEEEEETEQDGMVADSVENGTSEGSDGDGRESRTVTNSDDSLLSILQASCSSDLPRAIKRRIEELEKKAAAYNVLEPAMKKMKRKHEELRSAYKVLEMTKKKRKGEKARPEERQMLSEASYTVRTEIFRRVKFAPANLFAWSEARNSACQMVMKTLSFPPGTTDEGKRVIYEKLVMPYVYRAMGDCRNKVLQPVRRAFNGETCGVWLHSQCLTLVTVIVSLTLHDAFRQIPLQ